MVLIYGNYYGRRPVPVSEMVRARILKLLHEEVKDAQKRLQDATEYFDLAIRNRQSPIPTADRQHRLRLAARSYMVAAQNLTVAAFRRDRFILEGIVPEVLKAKIVRKGERATSARSRKSA